MVFVSLVVIYQEYILKVIVEDVLVRKSIIEIEILT